MSAKTYGTSRTVFDQRAGTEETEPFIRDGDGEMGFTSYDDVSEVQERIQRNAQKQKRKFCLFVSLGVAAILLVAVALYFTSDNLPFRRKSANDNRVKPSPSVLGKYQHTAIASDNILCSDIGRKIMKDHGGSAVDATVAMLACYSLVNPVSSGIGGGFFMTVYDQKTKKATIFDAREAAPLTATEDMYESNPEDSKYGGRSIAVPAEVAGYKAAHDVYGKLPWKTLFTDVISLAENGFPFTARLANLTREKRSVIERDPDLLGTYTNPKTGNFYKEGDNFTFPKMAQTLRTIAEEGAESFYNGTLSKDILKDLKEKNSSITAEDLTNYRVLVQDALVTTFKDRTSLFSPPPPSSGAVLTFILNILDGYDITPSKLKSKSQMLTAYHRMVEAFKFAYAKRMHLGDPAFVKNVTELVKNLTSHTYADSIRKMIWDNQTHPYDYYGGTSYDVFKTSTAHLSVIEEGELSVSVTTTVNLEFGSGVQGHRTGILFNDEMDDFSSPNQTNYFGIPPSPANFIRPGKRPLSSMCPAVLVDADGKALMAIGAAGGSRITTATAFDILRMQWFGDDIKQAIDARRLHHQLLPPVIAYEPDFDEFYLEGLKDLGHNITLGSFNSIVNGVHKRDKYLYANCDFRRGGAPAGY